MEIRENKKEEELGKSGKLVISEEDNQDLLKQWKREARKVTPENVGEFIQKLANEYVHDYGTIVYAMVAGALAGACAIDNSEQGGITRHQVACMLVEFIKEWDPEFEIFRIINYDRLRFPQGEECLEEQINRELREWIQEQIEEEKNTDSYGIVRWQSIVDGKLPFGFIIRK